MMVGHTNFIGLGGKKNGEPNKYLIKLHINEVMIKKIEITLKILIAIGISILIWEWFQII